MTKEKKYRLAGKTSMVDTDGPSVHGSPAIREHVVYYVNSTWWYVGSVILYRNVNKKRNYRTGDRV